MLDESKIYRYEEIDSTNLEAKRLGEACAPHGSLVVAKRQSAGRGRRGRSWESSKKGNLYFSLLLRPDFEKEKASMLTLVMALAVAKAVEEVWQGHCGVNPDSADPDSGTGGIETALDGRPGIKWPNDIVADGKKLAGILTEMNLTQGGSDGAGSVAENGYQVIIGVGINVVKQDFADAEIADKAISLEEMLWKNLGQTTVADEAAGHGACSFGVQDKLLADIAKHFEIYYEQFCREGSLAGLKDEYEAFLVNKGNMVRVLDPQGEYEGKALGINEVGELLVETRKESTPGETVTGEEPLVRTVYAGEVSVRGIYGYV